MKKKDIISVPLERIENKILLIRGKKVMMDNDLAKLYGVTTGNLNKAVSRNLDRFPDDFMFQLSKAEFQNLMFQIGISSWGGTRKFPRAFTEQGVAMLSSVLRSKRAIQVNIQIMRVFTKLREVLATHKDLQRKIEGHDDQIKYIFKILKQMLTPHETPKRKIGFLS